MWEWVYPLLLFLLPCGCQGLKSGHWAWAISLSHWLLSKTEPLKTEQEGAFSSKGFINNGHISSTKLRAPHCPYPWPILQIDSMEPVKFKPLLETWGTVWTNEVDLVQPSSERIHFRSRAIVKEKRKQHNVPILSQAWCFNHGVYSIAKK